LLDGGKSPILQTNNVPSPARNQGSEMQSTMNDGAGWAPRFLGIFRIVAGLLFVEHGLSKLFGWPHVAMFDHLQYFSLIGLAGVVELVGGALLTIGLFTRAAAFIMSGEMAFAYFLRHLPQSFFPDQNNGEAAILFCFLFFYFFLVGGGRYSIDRARG
jgi:putative oxidoreductase